MLGILNLVLGAILLVAGRRLFWLLVGGIGFIIGVQLATRFFHGSEVTMILAGLVLGVIFALLALFLESVAVGIAGFLGGGYVLLSVAGLLGFDRGVLTWVVFVIGGILGVILVGLLFNWALITISSLAGASLIVAAFGLTAATAGLVYFGLFIAGVLIQGASLRNEGHVRERVAK
jgi:hypothetical protein